MLANYYITAICAQVETLTKKWSGSSYASMTSSHSILWILHSRTQLNLSSLLASCKDRGIGLCLKSHCDHYPGCRKSIQKFWGIFLRMLVYKTAKSMTFIGLKWGISCCLLFCLGFTYFQRNRNTWITSGIQANSLHLLSWIVWKLVKFGFWILCNCRSSANRVGFWVFCRKSRLKPTTCSISKLTWLLIETTPEQSTWAHIFCWKMSIKTTKAFRKVNFFPNFCCYIYVFLT